MSWNKDQYLPDDQIVRRLITEVISPLLLWYAREVKRPMAADCAVYVYDEVRFTCVVDPSGILITRPAQLTGSIRVRFRKTFGQNKGLYHVEAIYPELDTQTGFTGFSCSGRMRPDAETPILHPASVTTRYNVRNWQGPSGYRPRLQKSKSSR